MDERADEIVAHLSAHRFLIELLYANGFATMPHQGVEAFVRKAKRVSRSVRSSDASACLQTAERSSALIGQILDAAAERAHPGVPQQEDGRG